MGGGYFFTLNFTLVVDLFPLITSTEYERVLLYFNYYILFIYIYIYLYIFLLYIIVYTRINNNIKV